MTDTGSKDLVFRNDSDLPIYIYTTVTDTTATVRIYGEKRRTATCSAPSFLRRTYRPLLSAW